MYSRTKYGHQIKFQRFPHHHSVGQKKYEILPKASSLNQKFPKINFIKMLGEGDGYNAYHSYHIYDCF